MRALEPGAVGVEADDEELRITVGPVAVHGAHPSRRRLSPAARRRRGDAGDPAGRRAWPRRCARSSGRRRSEDTRPILTGVLMAAEDGGLRLVATDSYRLAVRDLPGAGVLAEGQRVLVPSRALNELQRCSLGAAREPRSSLAARRATTPPSSVGHVRLTTRLIEGEFPNYRQLIPSGYPNRLIVGREPLLDAVRRVKLLARDADHPGAHGAAPDGIELTVITQDWGQATEDVDAKYEGAEMTVAFNPDYLIDGVEAIAGDEVALETLDALKPATLRPTESDGLPVPADAGAGVLRPAGRAAPPSADACGSITSG